MNEYLLNNIYLTIFYLLVVISSIILLDFMWIKRTQFFILDQKVSSGYKGLFITIKLVFSKDIHKIRQYYGNDIFQYIFILKSFMKLCFMIYFLKIGMNLVQSLILKKKITIWEFFIDLQLDENCNKNKFCYIQGFLYSIFVSLIILWVVRDIYRNIEDCCMDYLQDRRKSLQVRTFLIHTYKEEGLQVINEINYFLANQNLGKIEFYQLLDNQQKKYKIQQKIQYYSYMKDYCIEKNENNQKRNYFIPIKFYQMQFYVDQFYKLKTKLQCEDFDQFSGAVLICLERPSSMKPLINHFKQDKNICDWIKIGKAQYEEINVQNNIYSVQQISDKIEIVWQNVTSRFKWESYKNIFINLLAICIIIFLTTPSTLIHLLQVNKTTQKLQDYLTESSTNRMILNNLQTLLILAFNQLLLILIHKMVFLEGHICYSNFQISKFFKTTRYLLLNMLIMPFLAVKATDSLYLIITRDNLTYQKIVQQQFSINQSYKFVTLIYQSAFLTFSCSVLRFDELFFNFLSPKIANDMRNIQKNILSGFQFGYYSGIVITTMAMVLFLSKSVPFICLAGALYMFSRLIVDTFNLTAVFKQEMESNGILAQEICRYLLNIYCGFLIFESGLLYYNKCYIMASLLTVFSACFYFIIEQKIKQKIYFQCINKMQIDNTIINQEDRKKWLNLFKNPKYKDFELDHQQIIV